MIWVLPLALMSPGTVGESEVSLRAGFPWYGVGVARRFTSRLEVDLQIETASFARWESRVEAGYALPLGARWQLQPALSLGYADQRGELSVQGPQIGGSLTLSCHTCRFRPSLKLWDRELLSVRRTERLEGDDKTTGLKWERLSSWAADLEILFPVGERWAFETTFRFSEIDGRFAIPGLSLGLRRRL